MAWNSPGNGDQNKDKDPWTGKNRNTNSPDLAQTLRRWQEKLWVLLKKHAHLRNLRFPTNNNKISVGWGSVGWGLVALLGLWLFTGFFVVASSENAIILTLGRYTDTVNPGVHWIAPFIQNKYIVNQQKISTYSSDSQTLTQDRNILSVSFSVRYRIVNPRDYLFNVVNARGLLKQATVSAVNQMIGITPAHVLLAAGYTQIEQQIKATLAQMFEKYHAGLEVVDVTLRSVKVPDEVKEVFDDVAKAEEERKRSENQARAYAMQMEPVAKEQAQRLLMEAGFYKRQVVLNAQMEVAYYLAVLPEYLKAPEVSRERLYLEAMESILSNVNKVFVDVPGTGNTFYLPLDKWLTQRTDKPILPPLSAPATPPPALSSGAESNSSIYPVSGGY